MGIGSWDSVRKYLHRLVIFVAERDLSHNRGVFAKRVF